MDGTKSSEAMSPGLLRVMERARRDPHRRQFALAHLIDVEALRRAFGRLRGDAAPGVDGVTKEQYGQDLEENLQDLHGRLKTMKYRHQPIWRKHIPKENGKERLIGVSTTEDKIVQGALHELLEAIYEQVFLECSYGFRPGRGAHDALRALDRAAGGGKVNVILEADIKSFFDSVDRPALREMLRKRIADRSLMRLIGKCLHVGVLDGEEFSRPDEGTTQGSVISPILGNIYLHEVLDVWFEREVRPRLRGVATLIRYADDFVIGFEHVEDARRVVDVLGKRLARYNLSLQPDKTRVVDFRRPSGRQQGGKGPGTFDFLGFTVYWRRNHRGRGWHLSWKTRRARMGRAIRRIYDFCRRHRHELIPEQHKALTRRIRGHCNYFGVNDNVKSLSTLRHRVIRAWYKWLNRRSQRSRLTWERFNDLLRDFPLPEPRVYVNLWSVNP
jgi:group II intron reverse transcriptase/maturase